MTVLDYRDPDLNRCRAVVLERDTWRLKRGHGFYLHYRERQCKRRPDETGYCWQHREHGHQETEDA